MKNTKLLSVEEVAKKIGYSIVYTRKLIRDGIIKSSKVGSVHAVFEDDLKTFKRKREPYDLKSKSK